MRTILMLRGVAVVLLRGCGGSTNPKPPEKTTQPVQIIDELYFEG